MASKKKRRVGICVEGIISLKMMVHLYNDDY